jgi:hypothetical protein
MKYLMLPNINIKECLEENKLDILDADPNPLWDHLEAEDLEMIKSYERILESLDNKQKKNYYIYAIRYSNNEILYEFEWMSLLKHELIKEIKETITLNLSSINREFKGPKDQIFFSDYDIVCHRASIRKNHLKGYDTGDYYQDISDSIPDMTFYNLLGEYDNDLTTFAQKEKEDQINEIVKKILYTPPSLKILASRVPQPKKVEYNPLYPSRSWIRSTGTIGSHISASPKCAVLQREKEVAAHSTALTLFVFGLIIGQL